MNTKESMLIATGDKRLSNRIEKLLPSENISVNNAYNYSEFKKSLNKSYSLIVLDLNLPKLNIFHLLEDLHRKHKDEIPFYILKYSDKELNFETFKNVQIVGIQDKKKSAHLMEELIHNINRFLVTGKYRFSQVDYFNDVKSYFCVFENGDAYFLPRNLIVEEDLKYNVKEVTLSEDKTYFKVTLSNHHHYEIPWSFVRHHCDKNYEYYKNKSSTNAEGNPSNIGLKIKETRVQYGMSQEDLAKKTKIKRPNISRLESGKHKPDLETLEKISEALKIPIAKLFTP